MDHIICFIRPFVFKQEILVYKDGKYISNARCSISELKDTLYKLCKENNINNIHLSGNNYYSIKIKDEFSTSKYDNDNIIVNIM